MYPNGQCGSGPNIFVSQQKCSTACNQPSGKQLPGCLIPPKILGCEATQPAWMFDSKMRTCKMFFSGACGRGMNHFNTEVECRQICLHQRKAKPVCSAEAKAGYCLGYGTYWYFDMKKNDCFRYSGGWCGKYANGFTSYRVCRDACSYSPKHLPPQKPGQLLQRPLQSTKNKLPQPFPPTNQNNISLQTTQQIRRPN
uniref:Putative bilaris n=1 Tax=Rhipicephalus pulchellus TaxID=72859 RepID=L7LSV5_RHIPC